MMEYAVIAVLAALCFMAGWIIRSISVDKLVKQAKYDIKHVNALKQKEYKRGRNTGFGYGSGYEK